MGGLVSKAYIFFIIEFIDLSLSVSHGDLHSVVIDEFPKWQTLFHLQKFKCI